MRTPIVQKTLDPAWNKGFLFRLRGATRLLLEVFDADIVGTDDQLGIVQVDLGALQVGVMDDRWHPVPSPGKGDLHLSLMLMGKGGEDDSDAESEDGEAGYVASLRARGGHAVGHAKSVADEGTARLTRQLEEYKIKLEEQRVRLEQATEKERALLREKTAVVRRMAEEKRDALRELAERQKEEIRKRLADKMESVLDKVLDRTSDIIKDSMKDPDMPMFVQRAVDNTVDEIMPDVKEEIIGAVNRKLRVANEVDHGEPLKWCWNPFPALRAFILYHTLPYNLSIWQKIRDPWFYVFALIAAFPRYGVQQIWFLLLWLMKDKGDEFQLASFILQFKGLQFITIGLLSSLIGAAQYAYCASSFEPTCDVNGPTIEYFELGFFVLQIILVWLAFAQLPYSVKKGGVTFADGTGDDSHLAEPGCCGRTKYPGRGGRLRRWVLYDLIVFILVLGALGALCFVGEVPITKWGTPEWAEYEWIFKANIYWVKTLYGILSAPFILFKLPLVFGLVTHAKPTAYNQNGRCVPVEGKSKRKEMLKNDAGDVEMGERKQPLYRRLLNSSDDDKGIKKRTSSSSSSSSSSSDGGKGKSKEPINNDGAFGGRRTEGGRSAPSAFI